MLEKLRMKTAALASEPDVLPDALEYTVWKAAIATKWRIVKAQMSVFLVSEIL